MPVTRIYIDVDGTLVDDRGDLFPGVHEKLKYWAERYKIIVWSHTGEEWARKMVDKHGLSMYISQCLSKPDVIIDDNPEMILTFPAVLKVTLPEEWWTRPDKDLFNASRKGE